MKVFCVCIRDGLERVRLCTFLSLSAGCSVHFLGNAQRFVSAIIHTEKSASTVFSWKQKAFQMVSFFIYIFKEL